MDTNTDTDRRRFLALTGTGVAGLAGCSELRSERESEGNETPPTPDPDGSDTRRTVAMIVQPDPGALRQAQAEIREAFDSGDLSREAAERQLAEREQELIGDAIDTAGDRIDAAGAEHLDTVEQEGTLLVEGPPLALIDLLDEPSLTAVVQRDRFQQARDRAAAAGPAEPGSAAGTDADGDDEALGESDGGSEEAEE